MALPWHITLEQLSSHRNQDLEMQPTLLKHYCNIDINGRPCEELQTGFMCDIGMKNRETISIQRLIGAGMTIARLYMRDLNTEQCNQLIQSIRQAVYNYSAELEYVYPLAIIVDVKGPEIVTGTLKSKTAIELIKGENIRLTKDLAWRDSGTADCLYVNYDRVENLRVNDVIYIDSLDGGKVKLIVYDVGDNSVDCTNVVGGLIGPKMTVHICHVPKNLPVKNDDVDEEKSCNASMNEPFEIMEDQINWIINSDIDAVLVPNAQTMSDIREVKELLGDKGKHILVFGSLESTLGLENIDALLAECDGLFVDRSILSTDLPIEKIGIAQKMILAKCNSIGKPCIFKAVINEQIPTLCVTDIVNLILDGVDAITLELDYESPLKTWKAESIRMAEHCLAAAAVIARHAERIVWHQRTYGNLELTQWPLDDPTKSICYSAVELAMKSKAVVIICLTNSGRTSKILSFAKPICPIVAVTRTCHTARQMRFWRGVRAVHYFEAVKGTWSEEVESRTLAALDYCKAKHILRAGDAYVVVTGSRRGVGYCDSIRLLYASSRDAVF